MKDGPAEILKKRARLLAQVSTAETVQEEAIELMEFELSEAVYCLEMPFIADVQTLGDLTPLPGTPEFVLGLIAVRGRIRCVLDLKQLLDIDNKTALPRSKVVLLTDGVIEFGILVDRVETSRRVPLVSIQPPLPHPSRGSRFIKGLIDGHGVLLDAKKLLTDPDILVYQGDGI